MADFEQIFLETAAHVNWRSVGGSHWSYAWDQDDAFAVGDLASVTGRDVGIDCDNSTDYVNWINRIVFEFTTTMNAPDDGFIEVFSAVGLANDVFSSPGSYDGQFAFYKTTFDSLPSATTGAMDNDKWFGTKMAELVDTTAAEGTEGMASFRFRLTEAGLSELATAGTFYWAMLHCGDVNNSPGWGDDQRQIFTLRGGTGSRASFRHSLQLFQMDDLYVFSPNQGTTHPNDDTGCSVSGINAAMTDDGNRNTFDQYYVDKQGDGTEWNDYKAVFKFDFSSLGLSGTLVYCKVAFAAWTDNADETANNLQVALVPHDFVPSEVDGDEWAAGQNFSSHGTWDGQAFTNCETYKAADNYDARYVTQWKFVEAYSFDGGKNTTFLAEMQKVIDGSGGHPAGKAHVLIYKDVDDENDFRVLNGTVSDQQHCGPVLILGFEGGGGGGNGQGPTVQFIKAARRQRAALRVVPQLF